MEEATSRYCCPECDRAILNRKIAKCLYCGAALPAGLLLSAEAIAELNRQQQAFEAQHKQTTSTPASDSSGSNWNVGDAIDVIDIASSVIDIAGDIASGLFD